MIKKEQHRTSDFQVRVFSKENSSKWNDFASYAKNATFLFQRGFMDYHQDQFEDFSLMVFKNEKLIAILPANKVENNVYSHQGLSYGGLLIEPGIRFEDYILTFKSVLKYLDKSSIESFYLKPVPSIYNTHLSEEIQFVLPTLEAKLETLDSYFVLDHVDDYQPNRNRKRAIKLAKSKCVKFSNDGIEFFWEHI